VAVTPLTLNATDLSIAVGSDTAVDIVGTFNSSAELADYINANVEGVTASIANGELNLVSSEGVTIAGGQATTLGLVSTAVSGDLTTVSITTVAGANDAILRMDAALTAVNNLRSTFGAIQNRFETTIENLSTTTENLTASRSRIMDADFAAETAALSRAQILQQAGTAMVAQANQVPQGVLRLLQ
jgi:flagellin